MGGEDEDPPRRPKGGCWPLGRGSWGAGRLKPVICPKKLLAARPLRYKPLMRRLLAIWAESPAGREGRAEAAPSSAAGTAGVGGGGALVGNPPQSWLAALVRYSLPRASAAGVVSPRASVALGAASLTR